MSRKAHRTGTFRAGSAIVRTIVEVRKTTACASPAATSSTPPATRSHLKVAPASGMASSVANAPRVTA